MRFGDIKLATAGAIAAALLLVVGGSFATFSFVNRNSIELIEQDWHEFESLRSARARTLQLLISTMGVGGLIHEFKDFVLRGDPARQPRVNRHVGAALHAVSSYKQIGPTAGERRALDTIQGTIRAYGRATEKAAALIAEGKSTEEIDAAVRIDDGPALDALQVLWTETRAKASTFDAANPSTRVAAGTALKALMGYGGVTHQLRNFLVRRDEDSYRSTVEKLDASERALDAYQNLDLSSAEIEALEDVGAALSLKRDLLNDLAESERSEAGMDAWLLRLDPSDVLMLDAFRILERERRHYLEEKAGEVALTLGRIGRMNTQFSIGLGVLILLIFVSGALMLYGLVLRPAGSLARSTAALAEGDLDVNVPYGDRRNEMGQIARSLEVFRKSAKARVAAEKSLLSAKGELEQRATEAVGKALELEVAKTEAERTGSFLRELLDTIGQGIGVFDVNLRLVEWNAGFSARLELPENWASENRTMEDLVRLAAFRGDFGEGDVDAKTREALAPFEDPMNITPAIKEWPLASGRFIEIHRHPMPEGGVILSVGDVTDRKKETLKIEQMALSDPLTGLANRTLFDRRFADGLANAERRDEALGVMLLDLDGFKQVNDRLGHEAGDVLLKEVARRLSENCRETDTIARLGGDEFAFVLTKVEEPADLEIPAARTLRRLERPIEYNGEMIDIRASLGISCYPMDGHLAEELLRKADAALYGAKCSGKGVYKFFDAKTMNVRITRGGLSPHVPAAMKRLP